MGTPVKVLIWVGGSIAALVLICALGWLGQGNDFLMFKVFAPKYEAARRETFEQSKAYNQGMIQELRAMQLEYVKAKPEQKAALASVIIHRFADYDDSKLPSDLQVFMAEIKRAQGI